MKTRAPAQVAPVGDASWPLKCICNLCQCGGHRCSNFSWSEQLAETLARQLDGDAGAPLEGRQEAAAACQLAGGRSSYAATERYLTAGRARSKSRQGGNSRERLAEKAGDEDEAAAAAADDMLHVLVTRPEIAGKPRDNIVFEGDMDLRTTFETSYEALARMRLDHWRRHQESRAGGAGQSVSVDKQRAMNRIVQGGGGGGALGQAGGKQAAQRRRRRRAPTNRAVSERAAAGQIDDAAGGRVEEEAAPDSNDNREALDEVLIDEMGDNYSQDTPKRGRQEQQEQREQGGQERELRPSPADCSSSKAIGRAASVDRRPPAGLASSPAPRKQLAASSPISRVRTPASPLAWPTADDDETAADDQRQSSGAAAAAHAAFAAPATTPTRAQVQRPAAGVASTTPPTPARFASVGAGAAPGAPQTAAGQTTNDALNYGRSNANQTTPIDADLAPLICYDANMNRLERVGLRKRSKYRPSTSLRSGARGLFGDAEEAVVEPTADGGASEAKQPQAAGRVGGERQRVEPARQMGAAGATSRELDWTDNANVIGRRHHLNHANRTDHIKEQNIVAHPQGECAFQDKAAQPAERRRSPAAEPISAINGIERNELELTSQLEGQANEALERARQLASEEAAAAAAEESAVLAEIQRCTREAPELQPGELVERGASSSRAAGGAQIATAAATPRLDSRQSRQQRVCQHQSFNINENEYPLRTRNDFNEDYCIKIGGRDTAASLAPSSSRASQRDDQNSGSPYGRGAGRNEKAKNLFRESPDFILTTGSAAAAATAAAARQQRIARNVVNGTGGPPPPPADVHSAEAVGQSEGEFGGHAGGQHDLAGRQSSENIVELKRTSSRAAAGTSPCPCNSGCLVLNLDNRYEFVGSRQGHKYFIERELDAREAMLVSETA